MPLKSTRAIMRRAAADAMLDAMSEESGPVARAHWFAYASRTYHEADEMDAEHDRRVATPRAPS